MPRATARNRGAYDGAPSPWNRPQAPAEGAAVLSAWLLRRGRARHRHSRAGTRTLRRAGLRAPRDRAQPLCGRKPQVQGRHLRGRARRDSRYRGAGHFLRTWRAEVDSRAGQEAQLVCARRHLSAGHQGAPRGREIVLIGHADHPEVVGTVGQLPAGAITLVQSVDEVARFMPRDPGRLAYVTQTTLSVDDTADIVAALKARFPHIHGPHKEDICYATTNRQEVVKKVAPLVEAMVVVGSPNSSNTQRLKEVAERAGCPRAALVQRAREIDWSVFGAISSLGVTAGASAPEVLVEEVIGAFAERYVVNVETVTTADEDMFFPLPRVLRGTEAAE